MVVKLYNEGKNKTQLQNVGCSTWILNIALDRLHGDRGTMTPSQGLCSVEMQTLRRSISGEEVSAAETFHASLEEKRHRLL